MAGRGRAPKDASARINNHAPTRGELTSADAPKWTGTIPTPPHCLTPAALEAWATWFGAWFSAHWTAGDLPGLRQMAKLYAAVDGGDFTRAGELRLWMDTFGITPKGQQDRRWKPPEVAGTASATKAASGQYAKLRSV